MVVKATYHARKVAKHWTLTRDVTVEEILLEVQARVGDRQIQLRDVERWQRAWQKEMFGDCRKS